MRLPTAHSVPCVGREPIAGNSAIFVCLYPSCCAGLVHRTDFRAMMVPGAAPFVGGGARKRWSEICSGLVVDVGRGSREFRVYPLSGSIERRRTRHGRQTRHARTQPAATGVARPDRRARRGARSRGAHTARAARIRGPASPPALSAGRSRGTPQVSAGDLLYSAVLEPGTGKALELLRGQVLRVEQIEGGQCVDFNCFNLHDYKEYMHTGRTRTLYGMHPGKGHFMWSAPPRERPMMYLLEDTVQCNDVLFPRCSAYLYESAYGLPVHTNCHDIQAEAQREYGLTPDDVHDSFNLFMRTGMGADGRGFITRQTSKPGDYVELLALIDVLAVPNVCGADLMRTSNFSIKPVRLSVRQACAAERASVPEVRRLRSQRTPADFRVKQIKVDRELRRDPSYAAEFTNVPIRCLDLPVALDAKEHALLRSSTLVEFYGGDEAAALRDIVFSWWETSYLGKL